ANVLASIGDIEGWHTVGIGLRGRLENSAQSWVWKRVKYDKTLPSLFFTSLQDTNIDQSPLQLRGFSPEALASISYDLTNTSVALAGRTMFVYDQRFDTN